MRQAFSSHQSWAALDALRLDINAEAVSTSLLTIRELAEHYREKELGEGCGKTVKTRESTPSTSRTTSFPR